MALTWTTKDPAEVVIYSIDWVGKFTYDYITASTWTISVGGTALIIDSNTFTDSKTNVKLSAGTTGTDYTLINTITTSKGMTFKQAAKLTVTSL